MKLKFCVTELKKLRSIRPMLEVLDDIHADLQHFTYEKMTLDTILDKGPDYHIVGSYTYGEDGKTRLVGFGLCQISSKQILKLYVEPDVRNEGVATMIMTHLETRLFARHGLGSHVSLGVRKTNLPAIKLYEKLGYTQYVDLEEVIFMQKQFI